ncbi:MAG TPA: hypothetical protein VGD45_15080 [Steroidobacter sp.]|uniref:hypothetical protein n=1 Tax=Steroidobacter sp. TaxID=1978227 RepID=UPI002ED8601F
MLALLSLPAVGALLPVPSVAAISVVVFTGLVVVAGLWSQGWLGRARRVTNLRWLADGRWFLSDGRHENIPATLSADSRVGSRWLWLRWHTDGSARGPRNRSMLILQGDLPALDLRRLGVRLRLESVSPQPSGADARFAGA